MARQRRDETRMRVTGPKVDPPPRFSVSHALTGGIGALLVIAAYVTATGLWPWSAFDRSSTGSDRVIVASTLAAGVSGERAAAAFDRIRIPANATHIQLSVLIPPPERDERFSAELSSVEGRMVATLPASVVGVSAKGATVSVTASAPRDGDYVLRLRRVAGGPDEIVLTTAFRVARLAPDSAERRR